MLIQTAFVVAAFLSTWALVDFVLVFVTSLLPKHVEIDCAKQYAPQRIAIVGPPKVDTSLDTLGDCGSVVTEYALRPGQSAIECVWRVLESSPGLVIIRDVAHDSLELARLIRKAGYIGVLLFYGPKLPPARQEQIADANTDIDGVAFDVGSVIALHTWVVTRHRLLSIEFLEKFADVLSKVSHFHERKNRFSALRYAHRAVWKAALSRDVRLYSATKRLADEMLSGRNVGERITALERIAAQAHTFRSA